MVPWPLSDLDGAIAATSDGKTLIGLLWLARELTAAAELGPAEPRRAAAARLAHAEEWRRTGAKSTCMATVAAGPAQRLSELTLDFLAYLELERGLSRNTLEAYRSDLQQLGEFLGRRRTSIRWRSTRALLSEFVSELAEGREDRRPAAASTLQRKVACLRSFYRHLRREGLLDSDPTAELRPPRSRARLPRVLSRDQVNSLLAQPQGTGHAALRDRALLETMYACGLRASEAITLELRELDLEAGVLIAHGKGSKERIVPVGSKALETLRQYLDKARPALIGLRDEPHVFVNMRGQALSRQGLYKIVQRHARSGRPRLPYEPAHAAPHIRHASAGRRLRSALAAGDARPR